MWGRMVKLNEHIPSRRRNHHYISLPPAHFTKRNLPFTGTVQRQCNYFKTQLNKFQQFKNKAQVTVLDRATPYSLLASALNLIMVLSIRQFHWSLCWGLSSPVILSKHNNVGYRRSFIINLWLAGVGAWGINIAGVYTNATQIAALAGQEGVPVDKTYLVGSASSPVAPVKSYQVQVNIARFFLFCLDGMQMML